MRTTLNPKFLSTHRQLGFSMAELLVVIVLIATLLAVVFASLRYASVGAKKSACMNHLRNIGTAMILHANENGGELPATTHSTTLDRAWIYQLENLIGNFDEIRLCPADPLRKERLAARGTSYILNSYIFVPDVDAFGRPRGKPMNRLVNHHDPARTLLATVCSDQVGVAPGNDHTHSDRWLSWTAVCRDISPTRHGGSDAGGSNYLYADGHVDFVKASEMKRKITSGINPAKPPEMTL